MVGQSEISDQNEIDSYFSTLSTRVFISRVHVGSLCFNDNDCVGNPRRDDCVGNPRRDNRVGNPRRDNCVGNPRRNI